MRTLNEILSAGAAWITEEELKYLCEEIRLMQRFMSLRTFDGEYTELELYERCRDELIKQEKLNASQPS